MFFCSGCTDKREIKKTDLSLKGKWLYEGKCISITFKKDTIEEFERRIWCFKNDSAFTFGDNNLRAYTFKDSILEIKRGYVYKVKSVSKNAFVVYEIVNPWYTSDKNEEVKRNHSCYSFKRI